MPQIKQGGITVDAAHEIPVPETAHVALDRSHRLDKEIMGNHQARIEHFASVKPEQPSTNPLPSNKGLKMANHVHDVFKKR